MKLSNEITDAPKVGLQSAASLTAAFLSGAMLSLSAVMIPVVLETNTSPSHLLTQWSHLYHYGHMIMPAFCVSATLLYAYTAVNKRSNSRKDWTTYAAAAATTIAMVPFTWVVMSSTNNTMFDLLKKQGVSMDTAHGLIVRWVWLHAARSLFPLSGSVMGFRGILRELGA